LLLFIFENTKNNFITTAHKNLLFLAAFTTGTWKKSSYQVFLCEKLSEP